jgi:V/A-type H+-transporting ATPase subunit F
MGLLLVGIEGVVVHGEDEFKIVFETALNDNTIALILITELLMSFYGSLVYPFKLNVRKAIVQIPDRHNSGETEKLMGKYIRDAIGGGGALV